MSNLAGPHQLALLALDSVGEAGMYLRLIVGCLTGRPLGRLIRVVALIMEGEGLGRRRSKARQRRVVHERSRGATPLW